MDVAGRSESRATGPAPPAELLVVGYHLLARDSSAPVPIYSVAEAIHRAGLGPSGGRGKLAALLLAAAEQAGFEVRDNFVRPVDARAVHRRASELVASPPTPAAAVRTAKLPNGAGEPSPTPAPVSGVRPRDRLPETPAARTSPSPPLPAAILPSASRRSPPLPAALLPSASRCSPPPVSVTAIDPERLARVLDGPPSDALRVSLALRANALRAAAEFQDLVSLATLRGVDSHVYQTETVRRVLRVLRGRALLADEVGLGKTIEALMVVREYQLRGMARRALVLTPPALVRHWAGELEAKAGIEARTTEDPRLRDDPQAFWREEGLVVASLALARGARHASSVQEVSWDIVVVDEAHHVKNRHTAGWKLVDGIKSRFLLLLTATPVETDLEEIYNLVTLLKPGQLTTPAEFRRQFVDPKDPTAPRDSERLRRLLADVMVRNTRAQSGLALPPRYVSTVAVEPSEAERELYDETVTLLRDHAADVRARLVTSTLLLEAGSSPHALRATLVRIGTGDKHGESLRQGARRLAQLLERVEGSRKLDALLQIVRANEGRVLVFTRFRDTLEHIAAGLRSSGIDPALFHGGMSAAERHSAIERFRAGARVLVATDVGGEGQNLQFCQTLVNFDLPWNPMLIEQRIGRLHRMGQTGEVRVFNLCARGTVEDRVLEVLDRRLHLFELVVGEMDMVLGNLDDEQDLEQRILALYATARGDDEVARGFDRIAEELAVARGRYERVRSLDENLFRTDFEA